jgi:hypothetical protein
VHAEGYFGRKIVCYLRYLHPFAILEGNNGHPTAKVIAPRGALT